MKQSSPTGNVISKAASRRLATFFSGAIALYLVIGLASLGRSGHETFPFYSWFLFAKVPNGNDQFTIRLLSAQGKTFTPPLKFLNAKGYVEDRKSIIAHRVIENLGKALQAKDDEKIAIHRELLESNYLKADTVYEVVAESYHPVERLHTGKTKTETIAIFQTGSVAKDSQ
jgi:hypothetical protein